MDYIAEAKKFIQHAAASQNADVIKEHLRIADWCLCQEIAERDERSMPVLVPKTC
jgi:hypothetical protein